MTTETLTKRDVQLHTGTDPENRAHWILKREYLPGEPLEALCGHRFTPRRDPRQLPVCAACQAVFDDSEARALAAGYKGRDD